MHILNRREILKSAAAAATLTILPHWTHGAGPNDKLNTAHIGVGGMGSGDLASIANHPNVNVVALCDVDSRALSAAAMKFPMALGFADFRVMFDQLGDKIDAVSVSTPDHTHAPAAMWAMNLGKHVYCQKPLTHEVYESRRLREVAEEKKLVTQMGVQVHASREYRIATQIIQEGVIGKVREVHAWSSKNWGYDGGPITGSDAVPSNLNWDLWLGTARQREYKAGVYHPQNWRKLIDFGTGTLGDMGVHIFDTPYRALKLTAPNWVKTNCRSPTNVGQPERNRVEYEFPGTEYTTKTLRWVWYDGAFAPPRDHHYPLPENHKLPDQGAIFLGEKGSCLLPHVGLAQLFPQKDFAGFKFPQVDRLDHYHQWVDACLGKTKTSAHFGYASPLTEALLLGVVANRFPGTKLQWDAANLKVTNLADANHLIRRTYRKGFEVDHL
jgi:predicted dehydrogenase